MKRSLQNGPIAIGIDEIVGANIGKNRRNAGLSLSSMAAVLGATEHELRQIESGKLRAGAERILRLSKFMNVVPSDFFRDPDRTDGNTVVLAPALKGG